MKFVLIALAITIGYVAADVSHLSAGRRAVLDSATQGPNPQDIATPEPEYIDIDLPEPPRSAPVARPPPQQHFSSFNSIPPVEPAPAHVFTSSGYKYKRPVSYYRRYRYRY